MAKATTPLLFLCLFFLGPSLAAEPAPDDVPAARPAPGDWPWWRGPNRDDVAAAEARPPVKWSADQNVIWKVDLPGEGHATPCIWGGRIFVSAAEGQSQFLLCLDRASGKTLWRTELNRGNLSKMHPKNTHASATPACDGQYVFVNLVHDEAMHLAAVDMEGKPVWQKKLGGYASLHGLGASPVLFRSWVFVVADSLKGSFICAVHRRSGEIVWKTPRESYRLGTYASATAGTLAGRDQLLIQGPYRIFSYDVATGSTLWTCEGPNESASSTLTLGKDVVFAAAGFPRRNLMCVRADGSGDVTRTHVVWEKGGEMAYVPCLLLAGGLLYQVEDRGHLTVFEADSGKVVYEQRLEGNYSSSPVLAGGNVYVVNEKGLMTVFKAGRTFEQVAQNALAEGGYATPVFLEGRLYLRTERRLWCIGER